MKKLVLGLLLLVASPAYAHIRIIGQTSRDGDAQKDAPCGAAGSQWGASGVTTLEPGATIEVTIDEYVRHPGYFRISFGQDGDFKDPVSILPIDPNRPNVSARDQDKASDFCSNPTVLMDNLDAHSSGGGRRSYQVKLPNIECERCTLQIVQVMEDIVHGAYNVEVSSSEFDLPDLYHQCIDIKLEGAATGERPSCTIGPLVGGQARGASADAGMNAPARSEREDGCALGHGAHGAWLALLLLALRTKKKLALPRGRA